MLIGSQSEDIVHHAHRPVLVVRRGRRLAARPDRCRRRLFRRRQKAAELAANLGKLFGALMPAACRPAATASIQKGRRSEAGRPGG